MTMQRNKSYKPGKERASAAPKRVISASTVRYIKLGSGAWVDIALEKGELHFGYGGIPHDLALTLDRDAIKRFCIEQGSDPRTAAENARQVIDFYSLGEDCLWITFARGYLWWTFASPDVHWLGTAKDSSHGERMRKSVGGWKHVDINGQVLATESLSTKLTQVGNYRRTICAVGAREYLLRRLNGTEDPVVAAANVARESLIDAISGAIGLLHWADFETLVDIVFTRNGWHRSSALGGRQKTIDLELEQPTIGERVAVQVKSKASQQTLDDYIGRVDKIGIYDRLFFVCHSAQGEISAPGRADVQVWTGRAFAALVLKAGLHDWVVEKIA